MAAAHDHTTLARVRLLANFSRATKAQLFAAADVYVSLVDNLQETFGLGVAEGQAAGLPVLAADFAGYRDIVTDGVDGLLIPSLSSTALPSCMQAGLGLLDPSLVRLYAGQMTALDLEAVGRALTLLCHQPAQRQRLGEAARRAAERYRWPGIVAAYEAFWRRLAQAPQPPASLPRGPLLAGDGLQAYRGHAGRQLQSGDQLQLSDRGLQVAQDPNCLIRYDDVAPLLDPAVEAAILTMAAVPCTVANLRQVGRAAGAPSGGDVDFQLCWLLKHGALKLLGQAPADA